MGGGNPLKSVTKAVKKAVSQTSSELSRAGDVATKAGGAVAGAVQDPGTWMTYLVNPTAGVAMGGQKAVDNYNTLVSSEKEADRAEAERMKALAQQKEAQVKQEKMAKDKAAAEAAKAKERAQRMSEGRRGLLFQGKETGVKSNVLGG